MIGLKKLFYKSTLKSVTIITPTPKLKKKTIIKLAENAYKCILYIYT